MGKKLQGPSLPPIGLWPFKIEKVEQRPGNDGVRDLITGLLFADGHPDGIRIEEWVDGFDEASPIKWHGDPFLCMEIKMLAAVLNRPIRELLAEGIEYELKDFAGHWVMAEIVHKVPKQGERAGVIKFYYRDFKPMPTKA